jgi:four helix bundle protein
MTLIKNSFWLLAIGSSFGLETQLILAKRLELIASNEVDEFIQQLNGEQKQINALITKIKSR